MDNVVTKLTVKNENKVEYSREELIDQLAKSPINQDLRMLPNGHFICGEVVDPLLQGPIHYKAVDDEIDIDEVHYDDYKFIACRTLFGGNGLYKSFENMLNKVVESIKGTTTPGIPLLFLGRDTVIKLYNEAGNVVYKSLRNEISKAFDVAGIVPRDRQFQMDLSEFTKNGMARDPYRNSIPVIAIVLEGTSVTAEEIHDLYVERYMDNRQEMRLISHTGTEDDGKVVNIRCYYRIEPEACIVFADMLKYLNTGEVSATEYTKCMKTVIQYKYSDYLPDEDELDDRDMISLELVKPNPNLTKENLPQLYECDENADIVEVNIDRDEDNSFDWVRRRNRYLRMQEFNVENREVNDRYQYPSVGDTITYYRDEECDTFGSMRIGSLHRIKKMPQLPRANKVRMLKIDDIEVVTTYLCNSIGTSYHCPFSRLYQQLGFHSVYGYAISDSDLFDLDSCEFNSLIVGPYADYDQYDGSEELPFVERCRLYTIHLKSRICGFNLIPKHFSGAGMGLDD